jgi:hypothetical protein
MARSFEHKVQVIQIFIKKIYLRWPGNLQVKVTCCCGTNTPHKLSYLKLLL